jgi:hydroxypyruvate isomerase
MIVNTASGLLKFAANVKWMYTDVPFEARFDAAAASGFTGVEIAAPYVLPARRLRELLDAAGLSPALINTPAGPPGSRTAMGAGFAPDARTDFRVGVQVALEYAIVLGSPVIHVMAGLRSPDVDVDLAFATYVMNVEWAAERAREAGVRIVLEAINKRDQPHYGLASMETAAAVAQAIDPETVGVLFDVYHAQIDGGNIMERLARMRPVVTHVQIADNPGRGEPGSGEIAYERVLPWMAKSGYSGWVGCEYDPIGDTHTGLSWTERIAV